jgi:hypothetical protein
MACSQMTVRLAIAIAACVGPSGTLLAQNYQYQTPGYTAPTTDTPGNDTLDPFVATTQDAPPLVPDPTFRDRLLKLNGGAPATKTNPGFTTSDTTSSYSTSASPGSVTGNTTSSYSTVPDPGR